MLRRVGMAFQKRALERDVVRVDSDVTMRRGFFGAPKAPASSTPRAPAASPRRHRVNAERLARMISTSTSRSRPRRGRPRARARTCSCCSTAAKFPANFPKVRARAESAPHGRGRARGDARHVRERARRARGADASMVSLEEEGASDEGRQDRSRTRRRGSPWIASHARRARLELRSRARVWFQRRRYGGAGSRDADGRGGFVWAPCGRASVSARTDRESRYGPCADAPTPCSCSAARDEEAPMGRVRATAAALERRNHGCGAQVCEFDKTRSMISSEPETRALMTFWGKTLKVPRTKAEDYGDDVIELGGDATARAV